MTYTPNADDAFKPEIAGNSGLWPALIANDAAVYTETMPGMESNPYPAATSAARQFRFRWWGNVDNKSLIVGVRAVASSPTQPVTVSQAVGGSAVTVNVGADAWYEATIGAIGPTLEVIVSAAAPGAGTLSFRGIRCRASVSAPVSGTLYASGFRLVGTLWGGAGYPVPSEIVSRLRTNPIRVARDRPVCVAAHISDTIKTVSTKSLDIWGVEDSTSWTRVGRLSLPRCDAGERWYRMDAYTVETTPGTAAYSVRVGPRDEQWTGAGWHSWRVRLGPGPHEIWANVKPGSSNEASIRTLQAWRTEL